MSYRTELIQCAAVCLAAVRNLDNGSTALSPVADCSPEFQEVLEERKRQEKKWGAQNRSPEKWMVILGEEYGEACKDVLEDNLT